MNQCPFCKCELFSDDLDRCPSCGQEIVSPRDSDPSPNDSAETFASDEFVDSAEMGTVDDASLIELQKAAEADEAGGDSVGDSTGDDETYLEDELGEQIAEPGEQTVAFDEQVHGQIAPANPDATIPELGTDVEDDDEDVGGTAEMPDKTYQLPDSSSPEEADHAGTLEAEADADADSTYVEESDDDDDSGNMDTVVGEEAEQLLKEKPEDDQQRTIEAEAFSDQTIDIDDGDSYDETLVSDYDDDSATMDSSQTLISNDDADADELKTLQSNWVTRPGEGPEMTIKSRHDSQASEGSPEDTITSVPMRSMQSTEDARMSLNSPEYELLSVLGEGGMGVVWSAKQTSVDRNVAVKMIKGPYAKKRGQRNKFLAEAIVTGDLDHPNIVPIYDVGTDSAGSLFYAMKQVKGTPWLNVIKKKSRHENLQILLDVADAVAFAHARGIVHRDLKPENVMLGKFGEVLVMDWGLALPMNQFDKAQKIRQFSSMGGTPAYMSPEMATGPIDRITPQSDVYLLGAMLWEIVTGKAPHPGKKVQQCLLAAMRNTIRPTEEKGELIDIALKAMATNIEDRHPSVLEFQEDVRSYLEHSESLALAAKSRADLQVAQKTGDYNDFSKAVFGFEQARDLWAGNKEAAQGVYEAKLSYATNAHQKEDFDLALSLLSPEREDHQALRSQILHDQAERDARQGRLKLAKRAIMAMAACFLIVVSIGFVMIRAERNEALNQKAIAEGEREEAQKQERIADVQRALAEQKKSEAEKANENLQVALVEVRDQKDIAEEQTKIAKVQEAEAKKQAMIAAMKEQEANEQRIIAIANEMEAVKQGKIALMEKEEADKQRKLAEKQKSEADKQRKLAEMQEAIARKERDEADKQRQLAVAAKEAEEYEAYIARIGLAAAKINENAFDVAMELLQQCPPKRRNWEWGRLMHLCEQSSESMKTGGPVDAVAVSPDGKQLLTGSWDNKARIWDLQNQKLIRELPQDGLYVHSVAWSPDQKMIATAGSDSTGRIRLWDPETGELLAKFNGHDDAVVGVKFSPSGEWLLTCSYDETARIWDLANPAQPTQVQVLTGHSWWVWDGAFSPDFDPRNPEADNRIVTVSQDGKAIVWTLKNEDGPLPFTSVALLQDVKDVEQPTITMVQEAIFTGHQGPIYSVAYAPNGQEVATASYDKKVFLWNPDDVPPFSIDNLLVNKVESVYYRELLGHTSAVQSVVYSKDGQILVSGGRDNAVKVWSTATMRPIKTFRGHYSGVLAVDISPDGREVISGAQDDRVIIWHVDQYEEIRVLNGRELVGHEDSVLGAKFSNSGDQILTAGRDRTARLWNAKTGQLIRTFQEGHDFLTSSGVFLPGGRILATAAADNSVRLWNVESGTQILRIPNTGRSAVIAASPNGKYLITGHDPPLGDDERPALSGEESRAENGVIVWDVEQLVKAAEAGVQSADLLSKLKPAELKGHYSRVTAIAFSPQKNELVTCDSRGRAILWDLETQSLLWSERHHRSRITGCLFSPDGKTIYMASSDHTVSQVSSRTGQENVDGILKHSSSVTSLALSDDGTRLISVSMLDSDLLNPGSTVNLWNTENGEKIRSVNTDKFAINDVSFTPQGDHAIIVSTDNTVRALNLKNENPQQVIGPPLLDFQKLGGLVWSARFTEDGHSILTVGGSEAHIWDAVTLRKEISFSPHGAVAAAEFSPNGKYIVTGSWDNSAKVWDVQSGQAVIKLQGGHRGYVNSVSFSPDNKMVLTGSDDMTAKLWDIETGEVIQTYSGHTGRVREAIFSPDGQKILTVSNDRTARLWDVKTGQQIGTPFIGHQWGLLCGAFSPDGTRVVTGSEDNQARLWDVETHELIAIYDGHTAAISAVCFAEDGSRLFTASQDNSAKLWDATPGREGAEILTLTEQSQELTSISVSPDGQQVVTGSRDGTAVVWLTTSWNRSDQDKSQ